MASTQAISPLLGAGAVPQTEDGSTAQPGVANAFDSNSFMRMFLTQLKYQDPTNPLESYELAAQLAQFSTVEKLTQATSLLQNIQNYSAAINNAEMASLVGKDIAGLRNTVEVKTDGVTTLDYRLDSPRANVTVTVKDESGNIVHSENRGNQNAGAYQVAWDGKDSAGNKVSEGTYTVEVQGVDSDGNIGTVRTTVHGTAISLNLDDANPYYVLSGSNGARLPASDVLQIATPTDSAAGKEDSTSQLSNILNLFS
jgi:flagellar basal-body rod modification protein FlgD